MAGTDPEATSPIPTESVFAGFPPGTPRSALPWWANPMNNQEKRTEIARQIIVGCKIGRIVETGTYLGTTTAFLAGFGVPVTTAERNPDLAREAAERLRPWSNIEVRGEDSVRVLQALVREPIDREMPTFFYLDAHRARHIPLREEAELAVAYFPRAVMMIDDFAVPDDPGYGFGDEGPGRRLTLDYLLQGNLQRLAIYFPKVHSQDETGAKRGCVVATMSTEMMAVLREIPGLRRWRTRWT
jgi:hypothetical protein